MVCGTETPPRSPAGETPSNFILFYLFPPAQPYPGEFKVTAGGRGRWLWAEHRQPQHWWGHPVLPKGGSGNPHKRIVPKGNFSKALLAARSSVLSILSI